VAAAVAVESQDLKQAVNFCFFCFKTKEGRRQAHLLNASELISFRLWLSPRLQSRT
jgi:hypothetical protein